MFRIVAAVFVALHGLVHLFGFVVPWRLTEMDGFTYHTTALNGSLELGDTGVRLLGLAWFALAVAFVVAAVGILDRRAWGVPLTAATAAVSLVVCVLGLPEAIAGIWVNVGILAVVAGIAVRDRIAPAPRSRP
jgi:hypothetical protein